MDKEELKINNELVQAIDEKRIIDYLLADGFTMEILKEAKYDNMLKAIYDAVVEQRMRDSQKCFLVDQVKKVEKTSDISAYKGSLSVENDGYVPFIPANQKDSYMEKKRREERRAKINKIKEEDKLYNKIFKLFSGK